MQYNLRLSPNTVSYLSCFVAVIEAIFAQLIFMELHKTRATNEEDVILFPFSSLISCLTRLSFTFL